MADGQRSRVDGGQPIHCLAFHFSYYVIIIPITTAIFPRTGPHDRLRLEGAFSRFAFQVAAPSGLFHITADWYSPYRPCPALF